MHAWIMTGLRWLEDHDKLANWLAAVGTLAAVWVSLWLARRDSRTRLRVFVDPRIASILPGSEPPLQLFVTVANESVRSITIKSIGYSLWPRKQPMHLLLTDRSLGADLPCRIEHGEQVDFRLALDHWLNELVRTVTPTAMKKRRLRFHVVTTLGYRVTCKPGPTLRKMLREHGKPFRPLTSPLSQRQVPKR